MFDFLKSVLSLRSRKINTIEKLIISAIKNKTIKEIIEIKLLLQFTYQKEKYNEVVSMILEQERFEKFKLNLEIDIREDIVQVYKVNTINQVFIICIYDPYDLFISESVIDIIELGKKYSNEL